MGVERDGNRRLYSRATVIGSAIVLTGERYAGTYGIANMSASGALLVGDTNLSVGDNVRLLLQLHHRPRRFALEAAVARRTTRGPQGEFAVRFVRVSSPLRDALETAVLHQLGRSSERGVVLIVDAEPDDAERLESGLHDVGRETAVVHTPLDAVLWLTTPAAAVGAVVANASLRGIDGLSLFEFIAGDYPEVRRVLACASDVEGCHREAVRSGRVHALLEKPWTRDAVLLALGGPPT